MKEVPCAICDKIGNYSVLYEPNFNVQSLSAELFSARRRPDRIHLRIVRCNECGLIYSNPAFDESELEKLYAESRFTYEELISPLKNTYGKYIRKAIAHLKSKETFLEIGCGSGFMLEKAIELGFKEVHGVEPGKEPVACANPEIRGKIKVALFRKGLFEPNQFDLVCFFQTLDHVSNPNEFLAAVYDVLKPGGIVLALNHDVGALSAKFLGERCPIIDIEHTYLYDRKTMRRIFQKHRFEVVTVSGASTNYPIGYWIDIFPLNKTLKAIVRAPLDLTRISRLRIEFNPGNLFLIARK